MWNKEACCDRTVSSAEVSESKLSGGSTEISNSVAVDKYGGIYVVTASSLNRIQWDPVVSHTCTSLTSCMSDAVSHHLQVHTQYEAHYEIS
jgi:hypothetical protein